MAKGQQRFFSRNTDDDQSDWEDAWEQCIKFTNGDLRQQLRHNLRESKSASSGGSVLQSSASNNHSGSYAEPGSGAPAPVEEPRGWQRLLNLYDEAQAFLVRCATYGLDAFHEQFCRTDTRNLTPVNPAVTVDPNGAWGRLANYYSKISTIAVVGNPVVDWAVWMWVRKDLVAKTESRSDYGDLRLTGGLQYV